MKFRTKNNSRNWRSLSSSQGTEGTSLLLLKYVKFTQIWMILYIGFQPIEGVRGHHFCLQKERSRSFCSKSACKTGCLQRGTPTLRTLHRFQITTGLSSFSTIPTASPASLAACLVLDLVWGWMPDGPSSENLGVRQWCLTTSELKTVKANQFVYCELVPAIF